MKEEVEKAYENIQIEWIAGEQAVLTIYQGDEKVGKVNLYLLQTREEMHNMMKEKVSYLRPAYATLVLPFG